MSYPKQFGSLLEASSYQSPGGGAKYAPMRKKIVDTAVEMGYDAETMVEVGVVWADDHDPFQHIKNHQYPHWANTCNLRVFQSFEAHLKDKFKDLMAARHIGVMVKGFSLDLKAPVNFPDSIIVANRLAEVKPDRYKGVTSMWSLTQGRIVANMEGYVVFFDYDKGRPANLLEAGGVHADLYHALEARRAREEKRALDWEAKNPKKLRAKF
ncbi:Uu.00g108560.m01.CDS01 [Anthostomella pinea]|uniref:Uu.00g108560.m01.CDS01 n=1 Tax=Anthostomella pinea TaxID=933095 RepID=A0AAI8YG30_9PEZI|nr:Uu.00g108560.m01.CDS01 [Anthostomella pinea]